MDNKRDWSITESDDWSRVVVKYDGAPIVAGTIDLSDLVPALDSLRRTLVFASNDLNHGSSQARVFMTTEVREGSYEFAIVLAQMLKDGTLATGAKSAIEIAKIVFGESGVLALLKRVGGAPEKDIQQVKRGDGNYQFSVKGNNNTLIVVPPETAQLYHRKYVRDTVWGAIQPVTKPGMRSVSFQPPDEKPEVITPADADAFKPVPLEKILEDDSFKIVPEVVDVIKPSFDERKKWKLAIGDNVFGAKMGDLHFQDQVMRREILFGTGDKLEVRLAVRKHKKANPEYVVAEVVDVIRPNQQLKIFGDEET